jgi:hypothetical protein
VARDWGLVCELEDGTVHTLIAGCLWEEISVQYKVRG